MDEPLSNLDAKLRGADAHGDQPFSGAWDRPSCIVTHDQVEAMTLGDRVAVMREGVLQQVGPPDEVYGGRRTCSWPTSSAIPGCNLFRGEVVLVDGKPSVRIGEREVRVDDHELALQPALRERVGSRVTVGVRPEAMVLSDAAGDGRRLPGVVALCEALGSSVLGYLEIPGIQNGKKLSETDEPKAAPPEGSPRQLVRGTWAVGRFAANVRLAEGTHLEVSVLPAGCASSSRRVDLRCSG